MQPKLCSRCHKNVAVVFITRLDKGDPVNEGLCLKCAKELGIQPVQEMMDRMGITEEDMENLTNEMMSAFGGPEGFFLAFFIVFGGMSVAPAFPIDAAKGRRAPFSLTRIA